MRERKAPPIITTVAAAMDKAADMAMTPLHQFQLAEFMLGGLPAELAQLAQIRKAWLLQACERIGNAPVRHPRDGRG